MAIRFYEDEKWWYYGWWAIVAFLAILFLVFYAPWQ
jgi:hypothetical protein